MSTAHTNEPDDPSSASVPPPPPARPPLRRAKDDRILGGLAAGVARYYGLDVSIVRILMVLATFLTQGFGVIAYIAGVLIVPEDDDTAPETAAPAAPPTESRRDASFWIGISLLILGALWLFGGPLSPFWRFGGWVRPDVIFALVLIGFGVALWRSSERRGSDSTAQQSANVPAETTASPVPPTPAFTPPADTARFDGPASPPPPADPARTWQPPQAPTRERSILGRLTLGMVLVAVGALWLFRIAGVLVVGPRHLIATALLVIGLGLLVGAFVGRARWLIVVGLLLVPLVVLSALLRPGAPLMPLININEGAGEVYETPSDMEDLQTSYQLGAGRHVLDLRELDVDAERAIGVQVGAGEVVLHLPENVTANIDVRVGMGQVRWQRTDGGRAAQAGVGLERTVTIETGDGSSTLDIAIHLGVGEVRINSAADANGAAEQPEAAITNDRLAQPRAVTTNSTKEF